MNEILLRGTTPVAPVVPAAPMAPFTGSPGGDFSQVLLAELDGPAGAAPKLTPPAITLESLPVVKPTMVAPPAPTLPTPAGSESYTVQAGDSLSKIARRLGHGDWKTLYGANRDVVGANPNVIRPGQVLALPAAWQTAHAPTHIQAKAHAAPPTPAAAVDAAAPTTPLAAAPILPPPALPLEAGIETTPDNYGPPDVTGPTATSIATEAIDRLTTEPNGGPATMATLREALRSIPETNPSYGLYRNKVEAYAAGIVAPLPTGANPTGEPPLIVPAPTDALPANTESALPSANPAGGGSGLAPAEAGADAGEEAWEAFS